MSDSSRSDKPCYEARLCHVVKRGDFDGYGFNLHAEKGRAGQYIGKVDEGSPAESAGLRQGDRIVEVNSHTIGTETHKQVVERIKSVPNETKLLVIDPRADLSDAAQLAHVEKTKEVLQANNNNNNVVEATAKVPDSPTPTPTVDAAIVTPPVDTKIESTASDHSNGHMENGNGTAMPPTAPTPAANGSATATAPPSKTLNLHLSAAEFRAQLKSKKKYDPKSDSVDLRKKYEMIQKM